MGLVSRSRRGGSGPRAGAGAAGALQHSAVSWDDPRWIRDAWGGPIVIKGVHTADDARRAVDAGASAIVVSNNGGRPCGSRGARVSARPA